MQMRRIYLWIGLGGLCSPWRPLSYGPGTPRLPTGPNIPAAKRRLYNRPS